MPSPNVLLFKPSQFVPDFHKQLLHMTKNRHVISMTNLTPTFSKGHKRFYCCCTHKKFKLVEVVGRAGINCVIKPSENDLLYTARLEGATV